MLYELVIVIRCYIRSLYFDRVYSQRYYLTFLDDCDFLLEFQVFVLLGFCESTRKFPAQVSMLSALDFSKSKPFDTQKSHCRVATGYLYF